MVRLRLDTIWLIAACAAGCGGPLDAGPDGRGPDAQPPDAMAPCIADDAPTAVFAFDPMLPGFDTGTVAAMADLQGSTGLLIHAFDIAWGPIGTHPTGPAYALDSPDELFVATMDEDLSLEGEPVRIPDGYSVSAKPDPIGLFAANGSLLALWREHRTYELEGSAVYATLGRGFVTALRSGAPDRPRVIDWGDPVLGREAFLLHKASALRDGTDVLLAANVVRDASAQVVGLAYGRIPADGNVIADATFGIVADRHIDERLVQAGPRRVLVGVRSTSDYQMHSLYLREIQADAVAVDLLARPIESRLTLRAAATFGPNDDRIAILWTAGGLLHATITDLTGNILRAESLASSSNNLAFTDVGAYRVGDGILVTWTEPADPVGTTLMSAHLDAVHPPAPRPLLTVYTLVGDWFPIPISVSGDRVLVAWYEAGTVWAQRFCASLR